MFSFLFPKTKVKAYGVREVSVDSFEIMGIGQINPHCEKRYENEVFVTIVDIAFDSNKYDEKECLILTKYFSVRYCPKCKRPELIPVRLRINRDKTYLAHEEEIAFNAYEEYPSRRHFSSVANAYCNNCSSCFQFKIKSSDVWVKEVLKIKNKDIITSVWDEYYLD